MLPEQVSVYAPQGVVNSVVIKGRKGVVIIDTQVTLEDAQGLKELARKKAGDAPLLCVINTHEHFDHIAGNQLFSIPIISSENARDAILKIPASQYPEFTITPPDFTFGKKFAVHLGDLTVCIEEVGGHSIGQSVIYIPEIRVLITGDQLFEGRPPYVADADIPEWIESLTKLYALNPLCVIPGHGQVGGKSLLLDERKWLEEFMDSVYSHKASGLDARAATREIMAAKDLPKDREAVFSVAVRKLYSSGANVTG